MTVMTGSLRDRIAKATWVSHRDRQLAQLGMKPSEYPADIPIPDWAYAIADAVIAALGLQPETMHNPNGAILTRLDGKVLADNRYMRRWATPWEPGESPVK
jgi:hypothetical protein